MKPNLTKRPAGILGSAIALASVLVTLGLIFANPPQCPVGVTPDVVEATGCSVGANIGLGLVVLLAVAVVVAGSIAAGSMWSNERRQPRPPRSEDRVGAGS